jgi:dihydroorotate dehydrogenase (fumarate)
MADLSTTYLGLKLPNPIVAASSGLTATVDKVLEIVAAGAGAVVLKSLFEEQILAETRDDLKDAELEAHAEAQDFLTHMGKDVHLNDHLKMVKEVKAKVSVPVIASLNCVTAREWMDYAVSLEKAGADALELNVFIMPASVKREGHDIEAVYLDIARKIRRRLSIPIAMKLGPHFSGLASMIRKLANEGINGFVLFNRFYRPDVDIQKLRLKAAATLSTPEEMGPTLQWIALLSGDIEDADFAAATGVHDGEAVVKQLLVGARVVQVCSALYRHGVGRAGEMLRDLAAWMDARGYKRIADFNGVLCQERSEHPEIYERSQYIRALVGVS